MPAHASLAYDMLTLDQSTPPRASRAAARVERLAGNVGRLIIGDVQSAAAISFVLAALRSVGDSDALVIDLRQSRELAPALAALIASSLFDTAPVLDAERYIAPEAVPRAEVVQTPFRYLDRPVLIVLGPATGRVATELARNLKRLRRATVIGTSPHAAFLSPNVPAPIELAAQVAHLVALTSLRERRCAGASPLSLQAAIVGVRREIETLRVRGARRAAAV